MCQIVTVGGGGAIQIQVELPKNVIEQRFRKRTAF